MLGASCIIPLVFRSNNPPSPKDAKQALLSSIILKKSSVHRGESVIRFTYYLITKN